MTKHPIKAQPSLASIIMGTVITTRFPAWLAKSLLISRVHAKLLITSKEASKGQPGPGEPPNVSREEKGNAAYAVIRAIGGQRDLSNQPPRVTLMT